MTMPVYSRYWILTLARGVLAFAVGFFVFVVPAMARTILLLPFAIILTVLSLAVYGVFDSALVLMNVRNIPYKSGASAHLVQGVYGLLTGISIMFVVYDRMDLSWFVYLASAQAFVASVTEYLIAKETHRVHGSRAVYAISAITFVFAIALLMARGMNTTLLTLTLFSYLAAFGVTLIVLSGRMLFAEYKVLHPKHPWGEHSPVVATSL